jgi:hypothetical protein
MVGCTHLRLTGRSTGSLQAVLHKRSKTHEVAGFEAATGLVHPSRDGSSIQNTRVNNDSTCMAPNQELLVEPTRSRVDLQHDAPTTNAGTVRENMSDVLDIFLKLWGVHSTLLVRSEGTAILFSSVTVVGTYLRNMFQHVQPDFDALLYLGICLQLKMRWQGLAEVVQTEDESALVRCLALSITSTRQVCAVECGCRTSTSVATTPIK